MKRGKFFSAVTNVYNNIHRPASIILKEAFFSDILKAQQEIAQEIIVLE